MKKSIKVLFGLLFCLVLVMTLLGCENAVGGDDDGNMAKEEALDALVGTWVHGPYTPDGENLTRIETIIITRNTLQEITVDTPTDGSATTTDTGDILNMSIISIDGLNVVVYVELDGLDDTLGLNFTDANKTAFKIIRTYTKQ